MTETDAEAALRKMAAEIGDPVGGVLRSLLNMLDMARQQRDEAYERSACACEDIIVLEQAATLNDPIRRLRQAASLIRTFKGAIHPS